MIIKATFTNFSLNTKYENPFADITLFGVTDNGQTNNFRIYNNLENFSNLKKMESYKFEFAVGTKNVKVSETSRVPVENVLFLNNVSS